MLLQAPLKHFSVLALDSKKDALHSRMTTAECQSGRESSKSNQLNWTSADRCAVSMPCFHMFPIDLPQVAAIGLRPEAHPSRSTKQTNDGAAVQLCSMEVDRVVLLQASAVCGEALDATVG